MLIGLSGKMGSGKDTFAGMLRDYHRFSTFAFAEHLKETAAFMTGLPLKHFIDPALKSELLPGFDCTSRRFMELLGTECGRAADPDFWVKRTMQKIAEYWADHPGARVVVTDVRFPNEYAAIKDAGGFMVRIERTNNPMPQTDHPSNTALDGFEFDHVVKNDHDLPMLRALASFCMAELTEKEFGFG